jgi:lysophospholipase L1-like esterase
VTLIRFILFRTGAIAIGLISVIVLLEIGLAVFHYQPVGRQAVHGVFVASAFPDLGYEYKPNNTFSYRYGKTGLFSGGLNIPVNINSYGLRNPEISIEKEENIFRILVIGDSFTMGMGVEAEEAYPTRLQALIQSKASEPLKIEVINAGVEGYNLIQCAAWYLNRGRALKPDLLVWAFNVNDLETRNQMKFNTATEPPSETSSKKSASSIALLFPTDMQSFYDQIILNSQIYRLWLKTRQIPALGPPAIRADAIKLAPFIEKVKEACDLDNTSIIAVLLPDMHVKKNTIHPSSKWFASKCQAENIPVISLASVFAGENIKDFHVHPCDPHPNARAHTVFAEKISQSIIWINSQFQFIEQTEGHL